jgi:microcompartment protein CcmK/EutM
MFLAKVEGSVVATKKDPSMSGRKLLLLRPQLVDEKDPTKFRPGTNTIVAVDCLGAGIGEITRALMPLLIAAIIALFIITYVPSLTTAIPRLLL